MAMAHHLFPQISNRVLDSQRKWLSSTEPVLTLDVPGLITEVNEVHGHTTVGSQAGPDSTGGLRAFLGRESWRRGGLRQDRWWVGWGVIRCHGFTRVSVSISEESVLTLPWSKENLDLSFVIYRWL